MPAPVVNATTGQRAGSGRGDAASPDRHDHLAHCLERARAGDPGGLDEIVHELNPLLWHVARSQTLATEEAADVVQTAWLELLRRLHDIRSPRALTAWLVSTTRREAWRVNTARRRGGGAPPEVLDDVAAADPPPDERVGDDERDRTLWRHYRRLPDRCRALLRVVALVDRPDYDAVASAMAMPRGSVGPTRGRCLAKLREMLLADPTWSTR
jgi:RNA polymerase sigma factor (sigma-70 family)